MLASISVVTGGILGVLARWLVSELIPGGPTGFPWATLIVNISGAFALGVIGVILIERVARVGQLRTFLGIGLLGSYTTFSTMAMEGVRLIDEHMLGLAAIYWVVTLIAGQTAGLSGMRLGRRPAPRSKEM